VDLVYIDGNHTEEGCLRDLRLAARSTDRILVDDYQLLPHVRRACQRFQEEHVDFVGQEIENGSTGLFLLEGRGAEIPLAETTASPSPASSAGTTGQAVTDSRSVGPAATLDAAINGQHVRLTAKSFDRRYYEEHRDSGLVDYVSYGQWQRDYGRWLAESLNWQGGTILDVGCACGATAQGILEAGATSVVGIDLCEYMVLLGRARFPAPHLEICDAVNLHLFPEPQFTGLHCSQVAEHWQPPCVPLILRELHRVALSGATLFFCLDTVESCGRQEKNAVQQDPTHVCIRPIGWWRRALRYAGWRVTDDLRSAVEGHPAWQARFAAYDWDYLICTKLKRATRP
jgi:ubiquinone/menaquinone biosynthesis C-methylase UbiE